MPKRKEINKKTNDYTALATKLIACRKAKALRQIDVSELTGIKRVTLAAYEKGRILPPPEKLKLLAAVYDINVAELMKETVLPRTIPYTKGSTCAFQQASSQSQKQLEDFLSYYNRLEAEYKKAVFNVVRTLYMDNV